MKTEEELNQDILRITMEITNKFPELSKYISEMPTTISYNRVPGVSIKNLQDYYNSLQEVVKKYAEEHDDKLK